MTAATNTNERPSTLHLGTGFGPEFLISTSELQLTDRCDRCGAAAFVRAVKDGHSNLLFCGNHARRNHEGLHADGWKIDDQTYRAFAKPTAAQTTD